MVAALAKVQEWWDFILPRKRGRPRKDKGHYKDWGVRVLISCLQFACLVGWLQTTCFRRCLGLASALLLRHLIWWGWLLFLLALATQVVLAWHLSCGLLCVWFFFGWFLYCFWLLGVSIPGCFCLVFCRLELVVCSSSFFFCLCIVALCFWLLSACSSPLWRVSSALWSIKKKKDSLLNQFLAHNHYVVQSHMLNK